MTTTDSPARPMQETWIDQGHDRTTKVERIKPYVGRLVRICLNAAYTGQGAQRVEVVGLLLGIADVASSSDPASRHVVVATADGYVTVSVPAVGYVATVQVA